MSERKKLIHVISGLSTGGAEMMLYKLLSRSDQYDESVLCLGNNLETDIARKILALGVKIYPFRFSKNLLDIRTISSNISSLMKLKKTVRSIKPDVIHSWMYHGNVASILIRHWAPQAKLIWNVRCSLHDINRETFSIKASIKICRLFSNKPDVIVYNSKTSASQHKYFGFSSNRSLVLPNGFDCELFLPNTRLREKARKQYQLDNETLVIGVVARYHAMKGHRVCLEAVKIIREKGVNFRLFLIGAGLDKENEKLVELISQYQLEEQVTLLGEQSQIENFTRMFDVLISSSIWGEAFSNSIGEAMASAVPCVVTDVGDSAWIVGDTGIIVPPGDAGALAEGIIKLTSLPADARERLGIKARGRVVSQYSLQKVAQLYNDLYNKLTEKDVN